MKKNKKCLAKFDKDLVKKYTSKKVINVLGLYSEQLARDRATEADRRAIEEGDISGWML